MECLTFLSANFLYEVDLKTGLLTFGRMFLQRTVHSFLTMVPVVRGVARMAALGKKAVVHSVIGDEGIIVSLTFYLYPIGVMVNLSSSPTPTECSCCTL